MGAKHNGHPVVIISAHRVVHNRGRRVSEQIQAIPAVVVEHIIHYPQLADVNETYPIGVVTCTTAVAQGDRCDAGHLNAMHALGQRHSVNDQVPISPGSLVFENKRLLGSFVGSVHPKLDLPKLVNLYQAGRLDLDALITNRYTLDELPAAFEAMEAGQIAARGVIVFGD